MGRSASDTANVIRVTDSLRRAEIQGRGDVGGDGSYDLHDFLSHPWRSDRIGSKMTKVVMVAMFSMIFASFLMIAVAGYFAFFHDNPPFEVFNSPFPTNQTYYKHGERVRSLVDFCKWTKSPYTIHREFHNDTITAIPSVTLGGAASGTCGKMWSPGLLIPESLHPGRYKIVGTSVWKVNPFATRTVEWETQYFWVIGEPTGSGTIFD